VSVEAIPRVTDLIEGARAGEHRAVARLVSLVEDGAPALRDVMATLSRLTGNAYVIGITGSPGVGKSTLTSGLVAEYRAGGATVGVLAVDPTSPFSGGALLGDRIRMQEHATDTKVYIRSMATRGHLGGLAAATPQALRVLDAAGCDLVIVETVGVGQSEVEVAGLADTTVVLLAPGLGDSIQAAKAGLLEVGDLYVVNKADRDGGDQLARDLRAALALVPTPAGEWRRPIVKTVATSGRGVSDVVSAIGAHRAWLEQHGELRKRRLARARAEVEAIAVGTLRGRFANLHGDIRLDALAARVVAGDVDPYAAADELIAAL
jgi:LAO/AO transport system kinase